jgi:rare lipoprotein A
MLLSDTADGEPYAVAAVPLRAAVAQRAMKLAALMPPVLPRGAVFDLAPAALPNLPLGPSIVGVASFYDFPQQTASGDAYDPAAFTAAAQTGIRDKFGGIAFGRDYRPAYALAEYQGRKVIVKFNDVGPLRPGRLFDLSRAAMTYLGGLHKGVLQDVRVTPLPVGQVYPAGPVTDEQLATLTGGAAQTAAR